MPAGGQPVADADRLEIERLTRNNDEFRHCAGQDCSEPDVASERDLSTPLYSRAAQTESVKACAKFDWQFGEIRALTPIQRRIEVFLWGQGDCLSMFGGVFGIMNMVGLPGVPRRWGVNQVYRLPLFLRKPLVKYVGVQNGNSAI
jgi:hypothetical protein